MSSRKINLVIGASTNESRYSNKAIRRLREHGHEVRAIGLREGKVADVEIETGMPEIYNVDTVLIYLNPQNQEPYKAYIRSLKPRRVLFPPGTENPEFERELSALDFGAEQACSLVMLATGQY